MKTVTIEESLWQEIKDRVEQMRLACTGERELCGVQNDTEALAKLALECEGTLKLFYADGIYRVPVPGDGWNSAYATQSTAPPLAQSGTGAVQLRDDGEEFAGHPSHQWTNTGSMESCMACGSYVANFSNGEPRYDEPCPNATPPPSAEPRAGYEVERVAFEAASRKLGFWWESPCTKRKCHAPGDKDYEPDTFDEKAWLLWLAARQSGIPPPSQSA